ncbi:MAG: HNH endonuclease domain-containing protein [Anaerolineae bacterium]|nr:HNH endonuclease domain-containing protein [Anaerolineae bacterium]
MSVDPRGTVISTILRHDAKTTSYKIALIRAINDVALAFPDVASDTAVAIPLVALAECWLAYYWPFVDAHLPIWQGARSRRRGGVAQDMAFRQELTALKMEWESIWHMPAAPSDGFVLVNEMRVSRRRSQYPASLAQGYVTALHAIAAAIEMPIRYAGPGNWSVFPRPLRFDRLQSKAMPLPGTRPEDRCLVVSADVWLLFKHLSLWIEALCIHQWALFTEGVDPAGGRRVDRGEVYRLLTDRPGNRRPLTWERNEVDILLLEGHSFTCPWTQKRIVAEVAYDLDHLVPVSIYPLNELWNLAPTDPSFNQRIKRQRLPSPERLVAAEPILADTYRTYALLPSLRQALQEDSVQRFASLTSLPEPVPARIAHAAVSFIEQLATSRNIARF